MSDLKVADGTQTRAPGWTWLIVAAMVAVPILAWFFFIPVAVVCLVAACIIGTVGGAARQARAKARERKRQVRAAAVAVEDYWPPMP
ncbi:MAG TPA: hypothetical protein VGL55_16995 [Steroidobacteraceae bacterium]